MKSLSLTILISLTVISIATAQPTIYWEDTYGGGGIDQGFCVEQTEDFGFIIVGKTSSYGHGDYDVYLVKLDSAGAIQWHQAYGGSEEDVGYSVQQTDDYGYIIVGYTYSFGAGNADVYLIKTDSYGDTLWTRTFGDTGTDQGYKVQQTDDGGYIIGGTTNGYQSYSDNAMLIKTDGLGQQQWLQTYGGLEDETAWGMDRCNDGGYILAGYTRAYDPYRDIWLVKTNSVGTMMWDQHFGGSDAEFCYSVQQTLDGGFYVTGYSYSFGGYMDIYAVKTDNLGQETWSTTYGGDQREDATCGIQALDGGYLIVGETWTYGAGSNDAYIIKTNSSGGVSWTLVLGESNSDWAYDAKQIHDGGYIIVGATGTGWTWDIYAIRLGPDQIGVQDDPVLGHPDSFTLHGAYPNPFNPNTTISFDLPVASEVELNVFDINGRQITSHQPLATSHQYNPGHHTIPFDASGLPSGIYLYRLTAGEFSGMGKMVLLK